MSGEAHFEVYPQKRSAKALGVPPTPTGEFGWRFQSANGQITAVGGESFVTKAAAKRAARDFAEAILSGFGAARIDVPWDGPPILDVDE